MARVMKSEMREACPRSRPIESLPLMAERDGRYVVMGVHSSIVSMGDNVAGVAVFVERQLPGEALQPAD